MLKFTDLETAILDWICYANAEDEALRDLLKTAEVTGRDVSNHGYDVLFKVNREAGSSFISRLLDGPVAVMENMGKSTTLLFWLWPKEGSPWCLQAVQGGGHTIDLKTRDLAALRFTQLEPPPPQTK